MRLPEKYDSKLSGPSYAFSPNRQNHAYCEGCRTYVKVKDKSKINKGWCCSKCTSPQPVATTG